MSVVVLGTVALDSVRTPAGKRREILGGSAAHFSMAARFFTDVHLVAVVGEDFPRRHIEFLRKKGIILTSLIKEKGRTFRWQGEYKGDCNSAITLNTELGVLADFNPCVSPLQKKIKNIFLANIDPEIQSRLLDNVCCPEIVAVDSMNFWIKNKRQALIRLLKRADIFVANDTEVRDLSKQHNLIKAAKGLRQLGPQMVIIKKGEHGVLFYSDDFLFSLPAYPVSKVVDPTGAGDTFAGGFMGYLARAKKINKNVLKQALGFATVIASFNVEGFGLSRTATLSFKEVTARLRQFKNMVNF